MNIIMLPPRHFNVATICIALAMMSLVSCASTEARLKKVDVIAIADRVAVKKGYNLSGFSKRAEYNYVHKDNTWVVFYDLKPDSRGMVTTGGGFTVHVKDDTKETWLIPGR